MKKMKNMKKAVCLILSLLMMPFANLSVNAQQTDYENLAEYWYKGTVIGGDGWTDMSAAKGWSASDTPYTMTAVSSITNSDGETVALPENSYGEMYNRAVKLNFSKAEGDATYSVGLFHASWWKDNPDIGKLIEEDAYVRMKVYLDGTAEQAKNMGFYMIRTPWNVSTTTTFETITPKQWSDIYVPVKDIFTGDCTGQTLHHVRISAKAEFAGNCDLYIHEIGFAKKVIQKKTDYEQRTEYWYKGTVIGGDGWTDMSAAKGWSASDKPYTMTAVSSITNSDGETVALPENSYGEMYNRAVKLNFSKAESDETYSVGLFHASWWKDNPDVGKLIEEDAYVRIKVYFDGTAEQAKNMGFYMIRNPWNLSTTTTFETVTPKQWSDIYVPVKDIFTGDCTGQTLHHIRIVAKAEFAGNCDLYIHEIGFVNKVTVEDEEDNEDNNEDNEDEEVVELPVNDGTALFTTFFGNHNNGYVGDDGKWVNNSFGTWNNNLSKAVGTFTDEKIKNSGLSLKYDLYNDGTPFAAYTQLPIYKTGSKSVDISEISRDGYLKMSMYVDSDSDLDGILSVIIEDRAYGYAAKELPVVISDTNKWIDICINLADFDLDPDKVKEIYKLAFKYDKQASSKLTFYIQDIGFYAPPLFTGLSILDENGEKVDVIEAGKKYSVEVSCFNHTGEDIAPVVIAALYDGSALKEVKTLSETVLNTNKVLFEIRDIDVPDDVVSPTLKVFVWNGLNTMVPYTVYNTEVKCAGDYDQTIIGEFTLSNNLANDFAKNAIILREYSTSAVVDGNIEKINLTERNIYPFISSEDNRYKVPMCFVLGALDFDVKEISATEISVDFGEGEVNISDGNTTFNTFIYNGVLYCDLNNIAEELSYNVEIIDDMAYVSKSELDVPKGVNYIISNELSYNWGNVWLGPEGYVTGMVIHPKNSNLRYAKTDVGGIYKYDVLRRKWIPLMDSVPHDDTNLMCVRGLALDPNNEDIIYVACGRESKNSTPHDILKSVDGGKTWKRLRFTGGQFDGNTGYIRLAGECIAVDPSNSNRLYVGTSTNGLYVSNNAGESFTKISSVPSSGNATDGGVTFVLLQGNNVYCGLYGRGIYRSSDSGATFTYIEGSPAIPVRAQYANNKLYVSARGDLGYTGGLFIYEDNLWKDITPDKQQEYGIGAFLVRGNTVYADVSPYAPGSAPTYRSANNGDSWTKINNLNINPSCFVADPDNENGFWAPWGFGIRYITDNGNNTFDLKSDHTNIEELCGISLLSSPSENAPMLFAQVWDRGMMLTDHENRSGVRVEPAIETGAGMDFCEEENKYVVRAGFVSAANDAESKIAISDDYGYTFENTDWDKGQVVDVAMSAEVNGTVPTIIALSIGSENGIYRSTDLGQTWNRCNIDIKTNSRWDFAYRFLASDRVDGNTFYMLDGRDLYVTRDAGVTWNLARTFKVSQRGDTYDREFIKAIPEIEGGLWVRHSDGIYASYDFGATWNIIPGISDVLAFGFGKGIEKNVSAYAYGKVDGIIGMYMSDDLGVTWRRISNSSTPFVSKLADITGDRKAYGRVYVIESGRGVFYGEPVGSNFYGPAVTLNVSSSNGKYEGDGVYSDKAVLNYTINGFVDRKATITIDGSEVVVNADNTFTKTVNVGFSKTINILATDEYGKQSTTTLELAMIK